MPARKPYKKKTTRRPRATTRRKYPKRRHREGVRPFQFPMMPPARLMTKLIYNDSKELSAAAPASATNTYRTGSLFDPDFTGIGAQPGWWDQIKDWYRAYIVRGVKIRVTLVNKGTEPVKFNYIVSSSSDGPISTAKEWRQLGGPYNKEFLIPASSGMNRKYFSLYVDNFKAQGLSDLSSKLMQNNPLVAAVGATPPLTPFFQMKSETADGVGTHSILYKMTATFYVEAFNRKLLQGEDT